MKDVYIPDSKNLNRKISKIQKGSKKKLHVVSDFDKTLTKAFADGKKVHTGIAQIREGHYLTEDYSPKAFALHDEYHPIETADNISREIKNKKMHEWWSRHLELMAKCGMNKGVINDIIQKKKIKIREDALELLDLLHEKNIPLLIFSAGVGDIIESYLKYENKLYDNIQIISNFYKFDEYGKVIGYKSKIIHSLNKSEIQLKGMPYYDIIRERKNVILLGDSVDDLDMLQGIEHKEVIKIGFLNEDAEKNLKNYKKNFDALILNDGSIEYVTSLIKRIK